MGVPYTNFFSFKDEFILNNKKLVLIGLLDNSSYFILSKILFSGEELFLSGALLTHSLFQEEVENYNFFHSSKDILIYKAEDFKQGELLLESYFKNPIKNNRLIVITEKRELFDSLLKKGLQETLLSLNLFNEKPYEKTKRLYFYLQSFLKKKNVQCSSSVLKEFLSFCSNYSHKRILEELNKLICFVGTKKAIYVQDLPILMGSKIKNNFWEIRDLILKKDRKSLLELFKFNEKFYSEDPLSLIAFLRSQMIFGLSLIKQKISDKRSILFSNYGVLSLKESITYLLEIEQNIKNGKFSNSVNLEILFIYLTK